MVHRLLSAPPDRQDDLLVPFLTALPISGISISVVGAGRAELTVCASDSTAARIDELQFSLGEGPRWEVVSTGRATIIPNMVTGDHTSWPIFGNAVSRLGVGALFVFPLMVGSAVVGVADMYRRVAGGFDESQVELAQSLAHGATARAVHRATLAASREWSMPASIEPEMRREVLQATGMILVQLDTNSAEALLLLQAHAFSTNRTILDLAKLVVSRRLDFRDIAD